jgi:NADH-quinone oxidoreductase subunit I
MKFEGDKRKSVTTFTLDFTKCSLCGSCVEACKSNAIRFSREYNLASTTREEYVMDLFKRLEAESKTAEVAESTTPAAAAASQPVATAENQPAAVVASQPSVAVENKGESH